jgi:hypothetical protein
MSMPRDTGLARRVGHDGGGLEQPILDGIGEVDGRYACNRPLNGMVVEEVAGNHIRTEGAQALRPLVDLSYERANLGPLREQELADMPAGLTLGSTGCSRDENCSACHLPLLR